MTLFATQVELCSLKTPFNCLAAVAGTARQKTLALEALTGGVVPVVNTLMLPPLTTMQA